MNASQNRIPDRLSKAVEIKQSGGGYLHFCTAKRFVEAEPSRQCSYTLPGVLYRHVVEIAL